MLLRKKTDRFNALYLSVFIIEIKFQGRIVFGYYLGYHNLHLNILLIYHVTVEMFR